MDRKKDALARIEGLNKEEYKKLRELLDKEREKCGWPICDYNGRICHIWFQSSLKSKKQITDLLDNIDFRKSVIK